MAGWEALITLQVVKEQQEVTVEARGFTFGYERVNFGGAVIPVPELESDARDGGRGDGGAGRGDGASSPDGSKPDHNFVRVGASRGSGGEHVIGDVGDNGCP